MSQPNILFIMTDQQRWDALGCVGGWVRTPNLDRIAAEGVRFANAITNAPVCMPARRTLATGWYPHNTGIWDNGRCWMPPETPTWMQAVRAAGYRTSLFGKTHLYAHVPGAGRDGIDMRDQEGLLEAYGLDDVDEIGGPRASARVGSHLTARWEAKGLWQAYKDDYADRFAQPRQPVRPSVLPVEEYADVYVGRRAAEYLAGYDRPEPWMCWVSFGGPHEPWDAPAPYASMYDPAGMPAPVKRFTDAAVARPRGSVDRFDPHDAELYDAEYARQLRANYAGNITLIDEQIGEILRVIERRGELDNTVIAFSSDHGEMNGDHHRIHKSTFLNGAVRVPLLVRTPQTAGGAVAGSVCNSPVEWMDIGPTLVELAGGKLAHRQFGRSLCSVLVDPAGAAHREYAISEISGEVMVFDGRWKLAVNREGQAYMLFDLDADPDEQRNLAGAPEAADIETPLRLRIMEHMVRTQLRQ